MIDTHCHLDLYAGDREGVIERAQQAGLEALITIGSGLEGNKTNLTLSSRHDFVFTAVGIHPHDAKDCTEAVLDQVLQWTQKPGEQSQRKVVAVGETGLDYHYNHSPRPVQQEVFRRHLEIARASCLPVVVHSREAEEDTLRILAESGVTSGVLHCFSGGLPMAERAMEMGFSISFAGPVTFRKATGLREVVKAIPDDYLLVETDSPYLAPEPMRGRQNEPAFLVHTLRQIAELRGITFVDADRITTLNAKRLFRIGRLPATGEIVYRIRDSLYLNITNRCTSSCSFCVRFHSDYVKGHHLRLSQEPDEAELRAAIGDPSQFREIVFCGYGEPLLRLDIVKGLSRWITENGGRVRINTNGHGNLIHRRNILPELRGIVHALSVSLDAQDETTYNRICSPSFPGAYRGMLEFLRQAPAYMPEVTATVVEMEGIDIEACRKIAEEAGVKFRVRKLDVVG